MTAAGDLARRYGAITATESAALDRAAAETGVEVAQLMEVAGLQVARCAWRMLGGVAAPVHVVAGNGNNGGDALVAARLLAGWGCTVTAVVVRDPQRLDPGRRRQCDALRGASATVTVSLDAADARSPDAVSLTVDGLLGSGLDAAPREPLATVIDAMRPPLLSIDVPSGVNADDGSAPGGAVRATATCALAAVKRGMWSAEARSRTGVLWVADIGIGDAVWERCGLRAPAAVRGGALLRVPVQRSS